MCNEWSGFPVSYVRLRRKKNTGTKCMYIIVGGCRDEILRNNFLDINIFSHSVQENEFYFGDGKEKMNIKLNKWIKKMFIFCTYAERMVRKARLSFPIHIHDFDDMYMAQKFIHMAFYAYCLFCCFVRWELFLFLAFFACFLVYHNLWIMR